MRPRLLSLMLGVLGCHSHTPITVDAAPTPVVSSPAPAVTSAAHTVPDERKDPCTAFGTGQALDVKVFPSDQRRSLPEDIEQLRSTPTPSLFIAYNHHTYCDIRAYVANTVKGPFSNLPGSEQWAAYLVTGETGTTVLVADATGAIKALRNINDAIPVGSSAAMVSLPLFADGATLRIDSYYSADGMTESEVNVLGFVDGELRQLYSIGRSLPPGALSTLEVVPAKTLPNLDVTVVAVPKPGEGGKLSKAEHVSRVAVWDGKKHQFR
jgi:hypothetical protein